MKKIFSLAIMLMAFVGFTACDNDDENENVVLKDYALSIRVQLAPVDAANEDYQEEVYKLEEEAYKAVGLENEGEYLYIQAADSAKAAPQIKALTSKIDAVLSKSTCELVGHIHIKAVEKALISDDDPKNSPWHSWYEQDYGYHAVGSLFEEYKPHAVFNAHNYFKKGETGYAMELRLVGWIKSSWASESPGDFNDKWGRRWLIVECNLNSCTGSKYKPYLAVQVARESELDNYNYGPITDVIGVYMPGVPRDPVQMITFEGRYYYLVDVTQNDKDDGHTANLNRGNSGKDLYLYYTDNEYKGNYLTHKNKDGKESEVWRCGDCDCRKKYNDKYYREVHVYDYSDNMKDLGVLDTNWGAGGDWVGLNLAYRDMPQK